MIALSAFAIASCSTVRKSQIVAFDTPKPHYTLVDHCKKSEISERCSEGIEKALPEIGELIKNFAKCDADLSSCQQHSTVDEHFWTSKVAAKDAALESEKWKKWYWSLIAGAVAATITAVCIKAP